MAAGRLWMCDSPREKLLLRALRTSVQTLVAGGQDERPTGSPFILWICSYRRFGLNHFWHHPSHIIKWNIKILKSAGHCLKSEPGMFSLLCCRQNACNQDAAVCAWTGRVHSGCSEQLCFTPDYMIWSTNYYFSVWKKAGNLKRKFSCQHVIFKTWIRIKIRHRQGTSVTTLGCKMVLLAHWSSIKKKT